MKLIKRLKILYIYIKVVKHTHFSIYLSITYTYNNECICKREITLVYSVILMNPHISILQIKERCITTPKDVNLHRS